MGRNPITALITLGLVALQVGVAAAGNGRGEPADHVEDRLGDLVAGHGGPEVAVLDALVDDATEHPLSVCEVCGDHSLGFG